MSCVKTYSNFKEALLDLSHIFRDSKSVKALVFLSFSILIHCCILQPAFLRNGQESLFTGLYLRDFKLESEATPDPSLIHKTKAQKVQSHPKSDELSLFAPKKLSPAAASKLDYRSGLLHLIQSKTVYPTIAQDLEQTGTVVVAVELDQKGKITDSKLHEKSSYDLLNKAALDTIKTVSYTHLTLPTTSRV